MEQPPIRAVAENWIRIADYQARCWVQGSKKYKFADGSERIEPIVANFHARFLEHPWVREAVTEGWDRDLRMHVIRIVRKHILDGGHVSSLNIVDLMPPKDWIDNAKMEAQRTREAKEWQDKVIAEHGSMDAYLSKSAGRRVTPGQSVSGAAKLVMSGLTERSKAMAGEGA